MDIKCFYEEYERINENFKQEYQLYQQININNLLHNNTINIDQKTISVIPLGVYNNNNNNIFEWIQNPKEYYEYIKVEYNDDFSWVKPFFEKSIYLNDENKLFIVIITKLLLNISHNLITISENNKIYFILIDLGIQENWDYYLFFRLMFTITN